MFGHGVFVYEPTAALKKYPAGRAAARLPRGLAPNLAKNTSAGVHWSGDPTGPRGLKRNSAVPQATA
jgi:hypothetical protein